MGLLDKAKEMLDQHDDKVDQALDKAGELAKGRLAGHDDKIDGLVDQAQQRTGTGDTTATPPEVAPHHQPAEDAEFPSEVAPHHQPPEDVELPPEAQPPTPPQQ